MVINSDIVLHGTLWTTVISKLSNIFSNRPNYSIFILCASIGIMYDQQIDNFDENGEPSKHIPRTILINEIDTVRFLFQTAILTTKSVDYPIEKRMELAFDDKESDFNKLTFLIKFANYGVTYLDTLIDSDSLITMENLKKFLSNAEKGLIDNLSIDEIYDEYVMEEEYSKSDIAADSNNIDY